MAASEIYALSEEGSLRQGELLSGIVQFKRVVGDDETVDEPRIVNVTHPYAVIVTQDCDLVWDFQARQKQSGTHKQLLSILFCEVTEAKSFRSGRSDIKSDIWRRIKTNKNERYQFLEQVPQELDSQRAGVPDLCIDFKRCFCLATEDVYWQLEKSLATRRCRMVSPYAEHLTSRFFYFQSRVALPREHGKEPSR